MMDEIDPLICTVDEVKNAFKWWANLPRGACLNQMWEEATESGIPYNDRIPWLYKKYGKKDAPST